MLNLLSRWKRSRSSSLLPGVQATASGSPSLRAQDSFLQSLLRWRPATEATPWQMNKLDPALLPRLRGDFEDCLSGVTNVEDLKHNIQRATRANDFWHLRGWLYTEIARAYDQHEAERRLARLNRHFTRPVDTFFLSGPVRRQ